MIKLYFSTVKILAQRPTRISAVATILLITKTFTGEREGERGRKGGDNRMAERQRQSETETKKNRETQREE